MANGFGSALQRNASFLGGLASGLLGRPTLAEGLSSGLQLGERAEERAARAQINNLRAQSVLQSRQAAQQLAESGELAGLSPELRAAIAADPALARSIGLTAARDVVDPSRGLSRELTLENLNAARTRRQRQERSDTAAVNFIDANRESLRQLMTDAEIDAIRSDPQAAKKLQGQFTARRITPQRVSTQERIRQKIAAGQQLSPGEDRILKMMQSDASALRELLGRVGAGGRSGVPAAPANPPRPQPPVSRPPVTIQRGPGGGLQVR